MVYINVGSKLLQHTAFLYCSDALCTTLAVRYSPQSIAYAAVYAAVEACGQQLVNVNETQWWATKGLNQNHLKGLQKQICFCMTSAYLRYPSTITICQYWLWKFRSLLIQLPLLRFLKRWLQNYKLAL